MSTSRFPPISVLSTNITGLTSGRVVFGSSTGGVAQSTGLFWNDTNKRLGINTVSPVHSLTVNDAVNTFTAIDIYNDNASAANRNWSLTSNLSAFGDFAIRQSTAKDGNPVSAGTTMLYVSAAGAITLGIASGVVNIGQTSGTLGFLGATAVARQATTGTATGFTAGAGTAVTHLSTFTGNTGSAAYTIGDIVLALKNYGLMTA